MDAAPDAVVTLLAAFMGGLVAFATWDLLKAAWKSFRDKDAF